MTEPEDDWFATEARRRRWIALREDGPLFGLVPHEEAELATLDLEFANPDHPA